MRKFLFVMLLFVWSVFAQSSPPDISQAVVNLKAMRALIQTLNDSLTLRENSSLQREQSLNNRELILSERENYSTEKESKINLREKELIEKEQRWTATATALNNSIHSLNRQLTFWKITSAACAVVFGSMALFK